MTDQERLIIEDDGFLCEACAYAHGTEYAGRIRCGHFCTYRVLAPDCAPVVRCQGFRKRGTNRRPLRSQRA